MRDEIEAITGRKILISLAWPQAATVPGSTDCGVCGKVKAPLRTFLNKQRSGLPSSPVTCFPAAPLL